LIAQGEDGFGPSLTVRRWAGETLLNGRRLEESSLAVNDRLQVGPVEFAVVREGDEAAIRTDEVPDSGQRSAADGEVAGSAVIKCVEEENLRLKRRGEELASHNMDLGRERDELRQRVDEARAALQSAEGEIAELKANVHGLFAERTELQAANQQLSGERDELCDMLERSRLELLAAQAETAAKADEGAALSRECERLREENSRIANDIEGTAAAAHRDLMQRESELVEERVRLTNERNALEETVAELRGQLLEAAEREAAQADQLKAADELRAQFDAAVQQNTALAGTVAALTSQLETQQQSAATATRFADETELKLAEYEQLLAAASESTANLEQELAAALAAQRNFDNAREEWDRHRLQLEHQQAELGEQIDSLQERMSEPLATQASQAPTEDFESPRGDAPAEESAETLSWGVAPDHSKFASQTRFDESGHGDGSRSTPVQSDEFGFASERQWPSDLSPESPPFGRAAETPFDSPTPAPEPVETTASTYELASEPAIAPAQPASFIDRYSHLFAEERPSGNVAIEAATAALTQPTDDRRALAPPLASTGSSLIVAAPSNDEEESIEQYMARLLQRVRGDSQPAATGAPAAHNASQPFSGPLGYEPSPLLVPSTPSTTRGQRDSLGEVAGDSLLETPPAAASRKPAIPVPQTDLEALRALANESARRAISRHALRKYRRNAVTKVIVSALAAMTSVWLMLQAPAWTDWQFLGGCLAMVIAAIWAGETFRMLLESFRIAAVDETDEEIKDISAELQARLPIDLANTK
jgi:hypothetical protein